MLNIKVNYKERIDKYISDNSNITRNDIKFLIKEGAVEVDGILVRKPNYIPKEGSEIHISRIIDKQVNIIPQKMNIDIIFQNDNYVIINKENNVVVHPSPGHYENTLVNGLMYYFKNNLSNNNGLLRPGIIHRIDKDTTGLLIVAKNNEAHNLLAQQLKDHTIKRKYVAIVKEWLEQNIYHINLPIGRGTNNRQKMVVTNDNSKNAITHIKVLKRFMYKEEKLSLIECELETGRTHQIRVHLEYIKHPIFNDPIYGTSHNSFNQYLHAFELSFIDPFTNQAQTFFALPPKEFEIVNYDFNLLTKKDDSK
ncbi:RluA family pseudouridine synthase [Mycoplasma phocimorsus]|uniref:RluA family pseudouridine synthase n=1 Tax=Mycoplasma phocimorsus TaxID=3045839 RepID=UPI0024BF927E|nr:RluA family pseudouridine synthase [Mycoplasma phocimorsus]MDJ1648607.1 RluA family pseudouridine synthase [Mycoplasma phocimorsus]